MRCQVEISVRIIVGFVLILCHTHTHAQEIIELGRILDEFTPIYPSDELIKFENITQVSGYEASGAW